MDTKRLISELTDSLLDLDPIAFIENTLTISGNRYRLMDCGRDYLHEVLHYIAFDALSDKGLPVIIVKGRQVEMTTTATALSLYLMAGGMHHHITGIHVFPQLEQARRHSNKQFDSFIKESIDQKLLSKRDLKGMHIDSSGRAKSVGGTPFSVTQKSFVGSNTLYIEGSSRDGDRLRGIPADFLLFDEMQDVSRTAYENTHEAISHSKIGPAGTGPILMFGTPKDKNSFFYDLWSSSDQRVYQVNCPHCGHFLPITMQNFKHQFMVQCADQNGAGCGELFDKRIGTKKGKWVATKTDGIAARGYHISQLLIPTIPREALEKKKLSKSPRSFANEVLGQFYSGSSLSLSYTDVLEFTTKRPETSDLLMPATVRDQHTVMGIDWGGRTVEDSENSTGSYTVSIILSEQPDGKIRLESAERMNTEIVEEQIKIIGDKMMKYNVQEVCADIGYGHAAIQRLQEQFGDKIKGIYSTGNMKRSYSFTKETNTVTIDKSKTFEEVWDLLQQFKFCIPYGDPGKIEWLIEHISNIEVTPRKVGGMLIKKFDKSSATRPVDGFAALVYAYVALQYRKTGGFANIGFSSNYQNGRNMPSPLGGVYKSKAAPGRLLRVGRHLRGL